MIRGAAVPAVASGGRRVGRRSMVVVLAALAVVATACDDFHAPFLERIDGPVVLTGADLPQAIGADPTTAVGFRWDDTAGSWVQIPIQIDQRHVVDFGTQPPTNATPGVPGTVYGHGTSGVSALQYSDPGTFVGADPDPTFDADDELVFMARDAGPLAPAGSARPAGTTGPGLELELTDPTDGDIGAVYLFQGVPGADPSAGVDYVDYDFVLDSGDYATTYGRASGPNPESSTVAGRSYSLGFSDRWIHDELRITDASGVDILDGHKSRFDLGTCGRSNATFAAAEGAFVANIDGPVRGIRSYVGANSGPLTQRTFHFYRDRYEIVTDLRVHAIPSVMSFLDFSAAAVGMRLGTSTMTGEVVIDGSPDAVPTAVPDWFSVSGPQGVLLGSAVVETSTPIPSSAFHYDRADPPEQECWGDGDFLGATGARLTGGIPNTDPRVAPTAGVRVIETYGLFRSELSASAWAPIWAEAATTEVTVAATIR